MSNHKNLADLLKVCSILPALAIMPAMAETINIGTGETQTVTGKHTDVIVNDGSVYFLASEDKSQLAVLNIEDATISNVTTNYANGLSGYVKGYDNSKIVVKNSEFSDNKSDYYSALWAVAPAAGIDGGILEIRDSKFLRNEANDGAAVGAMWLTDISNTLFEGNKATDANGDGGVLFLGAVSQSNLTNVTFKSNSSAGVGGAISMRSANQGDNSEAKLDIFDSEFNSNVAATNGGAIYSTFYDSEQVKDSVYIEGTDFIANSANKGGAIYNEGAADRGDNLASMKVVDSDFVGNTATANGGAIYNASGMTIEDSEFSKNSVTAGDGGAIRIDVVNGNKTVIKDSEFSENKALGYSQADSGAISVRNGDVEISGTDFDKNEAKFGGAMYLYSGNNHHVVVDVTDSEFSENSALSGGAIVNIASNKNNENGGLHLTDVELSANKATSADSSGGGALFLGAQSQTFITRGTFSGNTSAATGGAISMRDVDSGNNKDAKLDIIDSVFSGNTAATNGGAIYSTFYDSESVRDSVYVKGTEFSGNSAERGGAIYTEGQADLGGGLASMKVEDVTFTGNTATEEGGAIQNRSSMNITGSTFTGNTANGYYGGAVYNAKSGTIETLDADFSGNKIVNEGMSAGGAITNIGKIGEVTGLFDKNTAQATETAKGGAIHTYAGSVIDSVVADFTGNVAVSSELDAIGGAIVNDGTITKLHQTGQGFVNNSVSAKANGWAGALYNSQGAVISELVADFTGNSVSGTDWAIGGALVNQGTIESLSGTFTNNAVAVSAEDGFAIGGAVYNSGTINFDGDVLFSNNTAAEGADIYNDGTVNIVSGTTTVDTAVAGEGILNVASDAVLKIGTATVQQTTLNIDGIVEASVLSNRSYGRLLGEISAGDSAELKLSVGSVGSYKIFGSEADINITAGAAYDVLQEADGTVVIATKAVEDIAANTGISTQAAGAVAGLANATSGKAHQVSLALQEALNSGDATFVETESKKLNPTDKPIAQAAASAVQNQVLSLTSGRMAGGISVGRAGGDEVAQENGFWMQGLFNKSKFADKFHGYTRGIALGADTLIDKKWTVGGGLAFNNSDVHANAMHTDIDSKTLFLYGQYKPNKWYVNGTLTYNMSEYTDTKTVAGVSASAEYDVDSYGAQIMGGYDFATGITTEAGLRYLHVAQDGYSDGFGLTSVKAMDTDFLSGVAGLKYAFAIENDWAIQLRPELRAAMTYDFISDDASATVVMPSVASYKVAGDRLSRLGGEFGIGLTALYKGMEFSVVYDLDLHKDYTSQTGMIKFRTQF